jgi:dTDP-4-dehydrorhamnose reductase
VRILLTGAGGQLGRDLQEALHADDIVALTHSDLDITDRVAVQRATRGTRPDWLINAAAFNDVDGAETRIDTALAVNRDGPGYLADAARTVGAAILHVSSDYVFDGSKGAPYLEEDPPNPLGVYGRSKLEGEQRVMGSKASAVILRTAWLYGRHGRNFAKTILEAAKRGQPLRVVADQIGSPTSTADLAAAICQVIRSPARGLFHVVNAGACTRFEFARAIAGLEVQVLPITTAQAGRAAPRPANASLASHRWQAAGFDPLRPWQAALRDFLDSFQSEADG